MGKNQFFWNYSVLTARFVVEWFYYMSMEEIIFLHH